MPTLEDIFLKTIIYYLPNLQTVKVLLQSSKRIHRIIKTIKTNPIFFCNSDERCVREFHIQNILNIFSGIEILQVLPEDLIVNFSQWEISKVNVLISSDEFPTSVPLEKLLTYFGGVDQIILNSSILNTLPLERLYLIQPDNISDINVLNCLTSLNSLKFVEFCLITETPNSLFFSVDVILKLIEKNVRVVINHPEMNNESNIIKTSLPAGIFHVYSTSFPFGSFNTELLIYPPFENNLYEIFNPLTQEFNSKIYYKKYYPFSYEGLFDSFLYQMDSLEKMELTKVPKELVKLPLGLKYLYLNSQSIKEFSIENKDQLNITRMKLKDFNKKIQIPNSVVKLSIEKLNCRYDIVLPNIKKLSIGKINGKKVVVNNTIHHLKIDIYPTDIIIPHSVKILELDSCSEVLSIKKVQKLIIVDADELNTSLIPIHLKKLELYNIKEVNLSRLINLEELYLNIIITKGFINLKDIKIPPNVQKLTIDINGDLAKINPQNMIDKFKLFFNFVPRLELIGPLFE